MLYLGWCEHLILLTFWYRTPTLQCMKTHLIWVLKITHGQTDRTSVYIHLMLWHQVCKVLHNLNLQPLGKRCGGQEIYCDTRWRTVIGLMAKGQIYQYPLDNRLCRDHCHSICCGKEKNLLLLPWTKPRFPRWQAFVAHQHRNLQK